METLIFFMLYTHKTDPKLISKLQSENFVLIPKKGEREESISPINMRSLKFMIIQNRNNIKLFGKDRNTKVFVFELDLYAAMREISLNCSCSSKYL